MKDVTDFAIERTDDQLGGKEMFLRASKDRSGMPSSAGFVTAERRAALIEQIRSRKRAAAARDDDVSRKTRLGLRVGAFGLPNPFKRPDGTVANRRRDFGPAELSDDTSLSEDSHFVHTRSHPTTGDEVTYLGVFDGVGSWRRLGVDPRLYSRAIARNVKCVAAEQDGASVARPYDVLSTAWRRTSRERIAGSATACVVTLDHELNQLSYVNLGDAGILVLRRVTAARRVGTATRSARADAVGEMSAVLVASQQLRDFNLPYQLGWTNTAEGDEDDADAGARMGFESPQQAHVASFPLQISDVVVVGTDGLFDNVGVSEITHLVDTWEREEFGSGQDSQDDQALPRLAQRLCARARELSLDEHTDSPFALLAKENDIMYGGGMPDDVTVVVLRVVDANLHTAP